MFPLYAVCNCEGGLDKVTSDLVEANSRADTIGGWVQFYSMQPPFKYADHPPENLSMMPTSKPTSTATSTVKTKEEDKGKVPQK